MAEILRSVGLDVGTTTTQLILSRLTVENRASAFTVPDLVIGQREILYRSPVYFTPLLGIDRVDGEKIRDIVATEYEKAGVRRENVDTGAVIITGETSRKENARAVLDALAGFAGDFVVATAGPDLESVLAAKGAGAAAYSAETGQSVLHMDIGGGTSNLAWIEDGRIVKTGCLNVGGRLLKFDELGTVTYVSPVLEGLCSLKVGDRAKREAVEAVAEVLVQVLEMAAGLRERTELLERLWTKEMGVLPPALRATPLINAGGKDLVFSFSGGVADCIEVAHPWLEFGDIGPVLGQKIRESRLCAGKYRLGSETIRATVIGAGSHSLQLSGSTVFCQNVVLPLKNRPVVGLGPEDLEDSAAIRQRLSGQDTDPVVTFPGETAPDYRRITRLAAALAEGFGERPVLVAVEQDMAKALGQRLAILLPGRPVLCIDGVRLPEDSYLDVGSPVGSALPVVVKTLVLEG